MKSISILGSTGSIGRQTLQVVEQFPDRLRVVGLAADTNDRLLEEQARRFRPQLVALHDPQAAGRLRQRMAGALAVAEGEKGLTEVATLPEADLVVVASTGLAALIPVLEAIKAKKTIAIANKEVLVAGGELIDYESRVHGTTILPVDSEHSAIFQCLAGQPRENVRQIWLTASGGPFRDYDRQRLAAVTAREALRHPRWKMGPKVTVDSATLMNKGLEIIEAHWLFRVPQENIRVLIHPQSIVHSLVALRDGTVLAQLGLPDMRLPIQYALSWPERWGNQMPAPDLPDLASLTFSFPDPERFPCLRLAIEAGRIGGTMPAVLCAADEVAVELFLEGQISFQEIPQLIEDCMGCHLYLFQPDLEEIVNMYRWAKSWIPRRLRQLRREGR